MQKIIIFIFLFLTSVLSAQVDQNSELYQTLSKKDSLLFNAAFNTCDLALLEGLLSKDFEFYHDQSGMTPSKEGFIAGVREGLCKLAYKARRELIKGSLEVYMLNNNGTLYGAIQKGEHRFYAKYEGQKEQVTSIAKFTHVWILEDGKWQFSRGLSYDHQSP